MDIRTAAFIWRAQQPWDRSPERKGSSVIGSFQDLAGQSHSYSELLMGLQVGGWVGASRGLFHQHFCDSPDFIPTGRANTKRRKRRWKQAELLGCLNKHCSTVSFVCYPLHYNLVLIIFYRAHLPRGIFH